MKTLTRKMLAAVIAMGMGIGLAFSVPAASQADTSSQGLRSFEGFDNPCPLGCPAGAEVCCAYHDPVIMQAD